MLIQRQQIIHLRQRWVADHKTQAAAKAVVEASAAAQKLVRKHVNHTTQPLNQIDHIAPAASSSKRSDTHHHSQHLKEYEADASFNLQTKLSPKNYDHEHKRHDQTVLENSQHSPTQDKAGVKSVNEFLKCELVKLKLEGFLDGRTNVSTLVSIVFEFHGWFC